MEYDGQTSKTIKDAAYTALSLQFLGMTFTTQLVAEQFFIIHALWIGIGPSCLAGLHS